MPDVIVGGLTWQQKVEVGVEVASRLRAKRPSDPGDVALATDLSQHSETLRQHAGAGPVARDARGGLVQDMKGGDRLRDRSISALSTVVDAWTLRDDLPDKQKDAALVQTELLPNGPTAIIELGYAEQTTAMKLLATNAAKEPVAAAIGRLGIADFIANIGARQAAFEDLSGPKGAAHLAGTDSTRRAAAASRRWDAAMRAIVNRLESIYDGAVATERAERDDILHPLAAANAVARARMAGGKGPATPATTPPAGGATQ